MERFEDLQVRLGDVLALNRPGGTVDHVLVALPSYSVGESLLSHYADRIPALEHRYLLAALMLHRIPACEMVFVSSVAPGDEVLDYYASLVSPEHHDALRRRLRVLTVPDTSPRSVAVKLLERPWLLDELRESFGGRPAFIEPWNVTAAEVEVARRLGAPINGTAPALWPLGFKSAGRRLFAEAGVPMPSGSEDVRTVDQALAAIVDLHDRCPAVPGVVIKHDDSGAGDGNVVVDLPVDDHGRLDRGRLRQRLRGLAPWYLADLTKGGVVEELVVGRTFRSPSVQVDLLPSGEVRVLATHEQVLDGERGQVYTGCRFPADPAYAAGLARHGSAVGRALARRGAVGRASIDFATASDDEVAWRVVALEVNLRKGGTTHPYAALRNLVPGRYEPESACWRAADGTTRAYWATDNLLDPALLGVAPAEVIASVAGAGLQFDHRSGTGVVLHMLSCLSVDGRVGLTAIGTSPDHAAELYEAAATAVHGLGAPV